MWKESVASPRLQSLWCEIQCPDMPRPIRTCVIGLLFLWDPILPDLPATCLSVWCLIYIYIYHIISSHMWLVETSLKAWATADPGERPGGRLLLRGGVWHVYWARWRECFESEKLSLEVPDLKEQHNHNNQSMLDARWFLMFRMQSPHAIVGWKNQLVDIWDFTTWWANIRQCTCLWPQVWSDHHWKAARSAAC